MDQNHQSARDTFEQAHLQNRSSPVSLAYTTSLIGSATMLWMACKHQPWGDNDIEQLNSAITFLKMAEELSDIEIQEECCRHLASVYDLLYERTKNPRDLDLSIDYYTQVLYMLHPQSPHRAPTLLNLAKQHFECYTLPNAKPDLMVVQRYTDEAQTLVGQVVAVAFRAMEGVAGREGPSVRISSNGGGGSRQGDPSAHVSSNREAGSRQKGPLHSPFKPRKWLEVAGCQLL